MVTAKIIGIRNGFGRGCGFALILTLFVGTAEQLVLAGPNDPLPDMDAGVDVSVPGDARCFGESWCAPNERMPAQQLPYTREAPAGLWLGVGAENGFIDLAINGQLTGAVIVDKEPGNAFFVRVNRALLKIAKDREHYLQLRLDGTFSDWQEAMRASEFGFSEAAHLTQAAFREWQQLVRLDSGFQPFHRINREGVTILFPNAFADANYLHDDFQFRRLQTMARAGRIQTTVLDLGDVAAINKLSGVLQNAGEKIAVFKPSNVFNGAFELLAIDLNKVLNALDGALDPSAIVLVTKAVNTDTIESMPEIWQYDARLVRDYQALSPEAQQEFLVSLRKVPLQSLDPFRAPSDNVVSLFGPQPSHDLYSDNLHERLGVPVTATPEQIDAAFLRLREEYVGLLADDGDYKEFSDLARLVDSYRDLRVGGTLDESDAIWKKLFFDQDLGSLWAEGEARDKAFALAIERLEAEPGLTEEFLFRRAGSDELLNLSTQGLNDPEKAKYYARENKKLYVAFHKAVVARYMEELEESADASLERSAMLAAVIDRGAEFERVRALEIIRQFQEPPSFMEAAIQNALLRVNMDRIRRQLSAVVEIFMEGDIPAQTRWFKFAYENRKSDSVVRTILAAADTITADRSTASWLVKLAKDNTVAIDTRMYALEIALRTPNVRLEGISILRGLFPTSPEVPVNARVLELLVSHPNDLSEQAKERLVAIVADPEKFDRQWGEIATMTNYPSEMLEKMLTQDELCKMGELSKSYCGSLDQLLSLLEHQAIDWPRARTKLTPGFGCGPGFKSMVPKKKN